MCFNVTVLGHSYCRDLRDFVKFHNWFSIGDSPKFNLDFVCVPGATFRTFRDPSLIDRIANSKPHILVVILGSNDIKSNVHLSKVKVNCADFYSVLRNRLPDCFIFSCQVEQRYLSRENRHGTPASTEYIRLSNHFNNWLSRFKGKNQLICLRGPRRLDNEVLYKPDKIHLNRQGVAKLFDIIKVSILRADYSKNSK